MLIVRRAGDGRHEVARLRRGARIAPRVLHRGDAVVRAAFVPTQAGPLAGDDDRVRVVVGAGAALVVEPVAATLALPGRARTELHLEIVVETGGRLVLDDPVLIVAADADVRRSCTIALEAGAVAVLRDGVVLGRGGEPPGALESTLRATLGGRPLLHDGLRVGPGSPARDARVALAPGHRVIASACLLGMRPPAGSAAMALEGPGALLRATGASLADVERAIAATFAAWSGSCLRAGGHDARPDAGGASG